MWKAAYAGSSAVSFLELGIHAKSAGLSYSPSSTPLFSFIAIFSPNREATLHLLLPLGRILSLLTPLSPQHAGLLVVLRGQAFVLWQAWLCPRC